MQIYAISDENLNKNLKNGVLRLLSCGIKFIQYRNKNALHDLKLLEEISLICKAQNANFIINDDINLALKVNASGVHLGQDDGDIKKARKILGSSAIIGASCYNSLELAKKACESGASYVAFGAVFNSKTKPNAKHCKLEIITKAKEILPIKICAIGGINKKNIKEVKQAGADFVAIVSALYENNEIEKNIKILQNLAQY